MRLIPLLLAFLLAACGGDGAGGETSTVNTEPATTAPAPAPTGPCGLKPVTFASERWQGSAVAPPGGSPGVVWEQEYTFSNPNAVDVRLSSLVVHLRLSGSGGYFLMFARSAFRPVADELIPPGRDQKRFAEAWLAAGNTPANEGLFASASAKVGGAECPVAVERFSTTAVPAHVLALPTCDPREAKAGC